MILPEVYTEPSLTSMVKYSGISKQSFIIDVRQGSKYASAHYKFSFIKPPSHSTADLILINFYFSECLLVLFKEAKERGKHSNILCSLQEQKY